MVPLDDFTTTYLTAVNGLDAEAVLALFADDAVFCSPHGPVVRDHGELREFFEQLLGHGARLVPTSLVADGSRRVLELSVRSRENEHGVLTVDESAPLRAIAIDHFTLDREGKIARMAAYIVPRGGWVEEATT